jgi:hypothetical protein
MGRLFERKRRQCRIVKADDFCPGLVINSGEYVTMMNWESLSVGRVWVIYVNVNKHFALAFRAYALVFFYKHRVKGKATDSHIYWAFSSKNKVHSFS